MFAMRHEHIWSLYKKWIEVSSFSSTPQKSPGMPPLYYLTTRPQLIASVCVCVCVFVCVCVCVCLCVCMT